MTLPLTCAPVGGWINTAPWRSRAVSLLRVPPDAPPVQANDIAGKRRLVAQSAGVLFVLWTGAYHTEARLVRDADRKALADVLR